MRLNPEVNAIFDFVYEDFVLEGYDPHPHIKAAVAVLGGRVHQEQSADDGRAEA